MERRLSPLIIALSLVALGLLALVVVSFATPAKRSALPVLVAQTQRSARAADAASADTGARVIPTSAPPSTSTATAMPTPTPTVAPPTVTPTATPMATPTPAFAPPQPTVALTGIRHVWQTWNNCGPATLTMNLSYYGYPLEQSEAGAALRLHEDDKNVGPEELAAYARSQGFVASVQVNGSAEVLRTLLSNGIPVLIETWHEAEPNDGLGHYRLLSGYDDAAGHWIAYDTYDDTDLINPEGDYAGLRLPYAAMDALWRVFNRTYVLIYPPEKTAAVAAILDEDLDPTAMWTKALRTAQAEVAAEPEDAFGWFNVGSSAVAVGDTAQAAAAFDRARALGLPWRMFWYQFGAFAAYAAEGRYDDVVALADVTLAGTTSIEELHYWRGVGLAGMSRPAEARTAWESALALNPAYQSARDALAQ